MWKRVQIHIASCGRSSTTQQSDEPVHKDIFPTIHQGRKYRIVVVPAPTATQEVGIFHRFVCIEGAAEGVYAHLLQAFDKRIHIIGVESRVESTHTVDISGERMVLYATRIAEFGFELMRAAEPIDGCYSGENLHCGGRTHELAFV